MPAFIITSPEGQKFKITAPQGATADDLPDLSGGAPSAAPEQSSAPERSVMDKLLGRGGERYQLWPERLARSLGSSVVDAATLPRDVMQGKVAPMSDEGIARATNFATLASPAAPMRAGIQTAAKSISGAAPAREELLEAAGSGYRELKDLNVPLRKDVVESLSDTIRKNLNDESFYAEDQPRTFRALERLKRPVGEDSTAAEVYAARTSLNHVLTDKALHPSDAKAAQIAIEHLDDYLSNVPGFAETAQKARGNYRAAKQSERVTEAQDRGQLNAATSGSGANLDNAMRQRIKALLVNKKIPKTPEEEALMREVAQGGKLTNIARLLSKLGPKHPITGWGSALAADVGGGSGAATATLALGALAQYIAERGTGGAIRRLDEAIRRNSPLGGGSPSTQPGRVITPPARGATLAAPMVDALNPPDALSQPGDALASPSVIGPRSEIMTDEDPTTVVPGAKYAMADKTQDQIQRMGAGPRSEGGGGGRINYSSAGAKRGQNIASPDPTPAKPLEEMTPAEQEAWKVKARASLEAYIAKVEAKRGKPKTLNDIAAQSDTSGGRIEFQSSGTKSK